MGHIKFGAFFWAIHSASELYRSRSWDPLENADVKWTGVGLVAAFHGCRAKLAKLWEALRGAEPRHHRRHGAGRFEKPRAKNWFGPKSCPLSEWWRWRRQ